MIGLQEELAQNDYKEMLSYYNENCNGNCNRILETEFSELFLC